MNLRINIEQVECIDLAAISSSTLVYCYQYLPVRLAASKSKCRRGCVPAREISPANIGQVTQRGQLSGRILKGEIGYLLGRNERLKRFWSVAIKPGRPVAMGVIRGAGNDKSAAFVGLPGNPVAVFVTFVRIVRPLLLRLAGALPEPLVALPARATFSYKKRKGRREYVRVSLRSAADGAVEAVKYAQDGAGVLTSLTETDGLAELGEEVTTIEPGSTIGYLSYAALLG